MMLKVLAGEELEERDILIPVELVDAENVEDYVFDWRMRFCRGIRRRLRAEPRLFFIVP